MSCQKELHQRDFFLHHTQEEWRQIRAFQAQEETEQRTGGESQEEAVFDLLPVGPVQESSRNQDS